MKYFRPELLARFRSANDDVASAAAVEWDQATTNYVDAIHTLRPELPLSVCRILDHFTLHDAQVLSIVESRRRPILTMLLRLEGSKKRPGRHLQLIYSLAERVRGFSLKGARQPREEWRIQYDEFDALSLASPKVFSHSMLLAGGAEMRIRFAKLAVGTPRRVIVPVVEKSGILP